MDPLMDIETRPGFSVHDRGVVITPFARALRVGIPRLPVGLIWNRPVSVLVLAPDGTETILPVVDVTRQAVWTIWGAALVSVLLVWLMRRK